MDEILPVSEEDLLEFVGIAVEVAQERYPLVKLVEIGVLTYSCFYDSILDSDGNHKKLTAAVLGVRVDVVPLKLILARRLILFLLCELLGLLGGTMKFIRSLVFAVLLFLIPSF